MTLPDNPPPNKAEVRLFSEMEELAVSLAVEGGSESFQEMDNFLIAERIRASSASFQNASQAELAEMASAVGVQDYLEAARTKFEKLPDTDDVIARVIYKRLEARQNGQREKVKQMYAAGQSLEEVEKKLGIDPEQQRVLMIPELERTFSQMEDPLDHQKTPALPAQEAETELMRQWLLMSPREQEVTALIALRLSNRQMAVAMEIAEPTVRSCVQRAFSSAGRPERIGLMSWYEAVVKAFETHGIEPMDMFADPSRFAEIWARAQALPAQQKKSLLTNRLRQAALFVAEGLSNKEIAEKIIRDNEKSIHTETAKNHIHRLYEILGVGDRLQMAIMLDNAAEPLDLPSVRDCADPQDAAQRVKDMSWMVRRFTETLCATPLDRFFPSTEDGVEFFQRFSMREKNIPRSVKMLCQRLGVADREGLGQTYGPLLRSAPEMGHAPTSEGNL